MDYHQFVAKQNTNTPVDREQTEYGELDVAEILQEFEHWMRYERGYSEKTIQGKLRKVKKFFNETKLELNEVTIQDRRQYKAYLLEKVRRGEHKQNYVASILTELNVFFCHFLGKEDLRVSAIEKEEISFERLTREDIDAMIAEVEKRADISKQKKVLHKTIIITLWNELPRISELCDLKLGDIKEASRKVLFRSRKRDNVPPHLRYPFATEEFLDAWDEYKQYRDSDDWNEDAPAFVQIGKNGNNIGQDYVRHMLKDYAARAGIDKPIYPHLMRKSAGTELCLEKPKLAQIQLGHKNIKTTLTNYTGPNEDDKKHIETILHPESEKSIDERLAELCHQFRQGKITEQEYLKAVRSIGQQPTEEKPV